MHHTRPTREEDQTAVFYRAGLTRKTSMEGIKLSMACESTPNVARYLEHAVSTYRPAVLLAQAKHLVDGG